VYQDRLGQLSGTHELIAACLGCGRIVQLSVPALILRYGNACPVEDIRKRIKCSECGKRTQDLRIVSKKLRGRDTRR
jgi:hypothetical protein